MISIIPNYFGVCLMQDHCTTITIHVVVGLGVSVCNNATFKISNVLNI